MVKNLWLTSRCLLLFLIAVVSNSPLIARAEQSPCWGSSYGLQPGCCTKLADSCNLLPDSPSAKTRSGVDFNTSCRSGQYNGGSDQPTAVCCDAPARGSFCTGDRAPDAIAPSTPADPVVASAGEKKLPNFASLIKSEPEDFIGNIVKGLLGLTGTVTVIMMVYGGLLWMTAAGNEKAVGQAKQIILWTAIGLALVFLSYAILNFLFNSLTS